MTANNLRLPTYKYDQNSAVMKKKKSRLFQKLATPRSSLRSLRQVRYIRCAESSSCLITTFFKPIKPKDKKSCNAKRHITALNSDTIFLPLDLFPKNEHSMRLALFAI